MHSLSPFERLPRELFTKIIEYVPEAVFHLRATSRILRARVDEFACCVENFELVEKLTLLSYARRTPVTVDVFIYVPRKVANLFEIRLTLHQNQLRNEFIRETNTHFNNAFVYKLDLDISSESDNSLKSLQECLGRRVGKVVVNDFHSRRLLKYTSELLEGIRFEKLALKIKALTYTMAENLLGLLNKHTVHHLTLDVREVAIGDTESLLIKISSLICALSLYQHGIFHSSLLGMKNADWTTMFVNMFSRKLDKLYIVNQPYPGYLDRASADALTERLPTLNKKIWFQSTCIDYPEGLECIVHDHLVKATPSTLEIKHISRTNEAFSLM